MSHITDKLYEKRCGIFTHYLRPTGFDFRLFNVKKAAEAIASTGAGYYFITIMQGGSALISPNATFDRIAGTAPGKYCSERDIVEEMADELKKYGIDLYVYYTGDGPYPHPEIGPKFGFTPPRKNVTMDFVEKWADVLREYSVRWGSKVNGWWIDGCYADPNWGFSYTPELLKPYFDAVKAGNPEALVAFNDGCQPRLKKYYPNEDFTCGERVDFTEIPAARFIDGAQAHILTPLGLSPDPQNPCDGWCKHGSKHNNAYLKEYVKKVSDAGGVLTVDVWIGEEGEFDPAQLAALKGI